jgi:hypothetical protein
MTCDRSHHVDQSRLDRDFVSTGRITRLGLWAVPAAGTLIGAHWLFPEGPQTPEGIARHFTSPAAVIQQSVLFFGGLVLLLFGVIALSVFLASHGVRAEATAGMVLSVTGIALFLPFLAIPIFVYPVLGQAYLSGHSEIAATMQQFSPRSFSLVTQAHLLVMLAVSIAGGMVMAVAILRSGEFPRWAGIVFGLGFVLTITDIPVIAWIGSIMLIGAGARIAAMRARVV